MLILTFSATSARPGAAAREETAMKPSRVCKGGLRRVMCAEYAGCLEEAIRRGWPDWTCRHCVRFQPEVRPADEWWDEGLACLSLINEALVMPGLAVESRQPLGERPQ